jgi:hypothetical protein
LLFARFPQPARAASSQGALNQIESGQDTFLDWTAAKKLLREELT